MLAASYWSLLAPAIEMVEEAGNFGAFAFIPVAVGFTLGAAFVYFADLLLPVLVSTCLALCFLLPRGLWGSRAPCSLLAAGQACEEVARCF